MKILIFTDNHFSQYSSILRKRGEKYSYRLENQIKSLNWVNELASYHNCNFIVCAGDFFDKSELNAEELSALKEINWTDNDWIFLAGNHEMAQVNHFYTSTNLFKLLPGAEVITTPININIDNMEICFLPYTLEENRKTIYEYFGTQTKYRLIISHNDIADYVMGKFVSKTGFSIKDIQDNCDLYLNGHLHNGGKVTDKIINIGNLTGQNFSENAEVYSHSAIIFDTETKKCAVYDNPYAINFYKLDSYNDKTILPNSVITVRVNELDASSVREAIRNNPNIIESRLIVEYQKSNNISNENSFSVDHLDLFKKYIEELPDCTPELMSELYEVLK